MVAGSPVLNQSGPPEFVFRVFTTVPEFQALLFLLFLLLYLMILCGNTAIVWAVCTHSSLRTPMYFFLSNLSFVEISYTTVVVPSMLSNIVGAGKPIPLAGCGAQMFFFLTLGGADCFLLAIMAYDRYVAICHPLRYPSVVTERFVINAALFIVFRNLVATLPTPVLAARLNYCASNVVENCICANISVAKLSCGDIHLNKLYQFVSVWCLLGSDLVLILLSYCFILRAVMHLQSWGAATKALSTCGSHLILILFFYTLLLVFIFTNKAGKKVPPQVPILLNVLHHLIPPALNPIVYGVRTQEIKQGIIKLLKYHR